MDKILIESDLRDVTNRSSLFANHLKKILIVKGILEELITIQYKNS